MIQALRNKQLISLIAAAAFALPALAQAAALDQFRSFVASTKSARGEFSQRLVKNNNGRARGRYFIHFLSDLNRPMSKPEAMAERQ